MATNTDQIITQLVADTKKFDGAINGSIQVIKRFNKAGEEIGSRVRVVTRHMTEASKETDGFRVTMTRLSRDIKVAGTIFNTLEAGIKKAYSAASEGAKIMAAEQFFKNAGKSIAEYRKATNGMVSDAELMKKANLADSMGIDEKTFKKLVMVAEASALKTGQSFDYMFNSIIVGTARSSRLLLDNLGIIVSVGQANESYAQSIGKTVEELTDQEKQLAFVAEVARKSQGTLDEYAKTTDRTAESFARFDASVDNLANTIKVSLAKAFADLMPSLTSFVQELTTAIERGRWMDVGQSIGLRILQGLSTAFAKVDPTLGNTSFFTKVSEAAGKQIDLNNYVTRMDIQAEKTNNLSGLTQAQKEIEKMTSESLPTLIRRFDTMKTTGSEALDNALSDLLKYNKALEDYLDLAKLFSSRPIKPVEVPSKSGGGRGAAIDSFLRKNARDEAFAKGTDIEEEEEAAAKEREEAIKAANEAGDQYNKMRSFVESGPKFAAPFNSGVVQFGKNAEQFNDYLKDHAKRQTEIFDDWLLRFGQVMGSSVEQILTGQGLARPLANIATGGDLAGGIMDMLGSALSGTAMAPMMATMGAPGGPLGMAIGALVGVLLDAVDNLKPVMDLIGGILSGFTQLIGNAMLEFLTPLSILAGPINDLLAAIGLITGSALRPFVAIFTLAVGIISVVVQVFTALFTVLSPFVEMAFWILSVLLSGGQTLLPLFMDLGETTKAITDAMNTAIGVILSAAIGLNNGIVSFARNTLKLKGFGKYLSIDDFKGDPNPGTDDDDNKDALNENTKALKDFTREFRNLPQSYKGTGAIYAAQDRQGRPTRVSFDIGRDGMLAAASLYRWRS